MNISSAFLTRAVFVSTVAAGAAFSSAAQQPAIPVPQPHWDRSVLPIAPAPFRGNVRELIGESTAIPRAMLTAPPGAPNILLVLLDDAGYGQTSTFGGLIPTPTLDSLAASGLRYTRFHVTAMCSPTRAALLTGRNHHAVNMGLIANWNSDYPGYTGAIPASAALVSETLRDNGYATACFGKWHLIPENEMNESGPFTHWPTHEGFDYYYGFPGGETDQWHPTLVEGTTPIEMAVPPGRAQDYTLNDALADQAIAWIEREHSEAPGRPFFIYYAPGATHAPLQAPRSWINKFRGKFDMGWDRYREIVLARQKQLGVVPADTVLTPRPPQLRAYDSLTPTEKRVAARLMEVFAGYMAQTDYDLGRVIDAIRAQGELNNTLILVIAGDNGASLEGGPTGTDNETAEFNGVPATPQQILSHLNELGGPDTSPLYPAAWAWAGNTPFRWGKRNAAYLGGTRDPLIVSWPARIRAPGGLRSQYLHVIDVAPTLLEAAGVPEPRVVNGATQQPMDGVSFIDTFNDASAPELHHMQYFEMVGTRAMYSDGWIASSPTGELPWLNKINVDIATLPWHLFHLDDDYSESRDLAQQFPGKVASLRELFREQALKNHVYPLDLFAGSRTSHPAKNHYVYYGAGILEYPYFSPQFASRSYTVTADLDPMSTHANGVLLAKGGAYGGFSLYMRNGHLNYTYNYFRRRITTIRSPDVLGPGPQHVELRFAYSGGGVGKSALVTLAINGKIVAETKLPETVRYSFFDDTFDIGEDSASPVGPYNAPFPFSGKLIKTVIDTDGNTDMPASETVAEKRGMRQ